MNNITKKIHANLAFSSGSVFDTSIGHHLQNVIPGFKERMSLVEMFWMVNYRNTTLNFGRNINFLLEKI